MCALKVTRSAIAATRRGVGEDGALGDFDIESDGTSTVLTGDLDQAVLYGALNRIHSRGLEVCARAY